MNILLFREIELIKLNELKNAEIEIIDCIRDAVSSVVKPWFLTMIIAALKTVCRVAVSNLCSTGAHCCTSLQIQIFLQKEILLTWASMVFAFSQPFFVFLLSYRAVLSLTSILPNILC